MFTWDVYVHDDLYLITFADLADNFACSWIDNREGFSTLGVNKLSINEELKKAKEWHKHINMNTILNDASHIMS